MVGDPLDIPAEGRVEDRRQVGRLGDLQTRAHAGDAEPGPALQELRLAHPSGRVPLAGSGRAVPGRCARWRACHGQTYGEPDRHQRSRPSGSSGRLCVSFQCHGSIATQDLGPETPGHRASGRDAPLERAPAPAAASSSARRAHPPRPRLVGRRRASGGVPESACRWVPHGRRTASRIAPVQDHARRAIRNPLRRAGRPRPGASTRDRADKAAIGTIDSTAG